MPNQRYEDMCDKALASEQQDNRESNIKERMKELTEQIQDFNPVKKMNSKEKLAQALQQEFENRLKTRGLFNLYQMIQIAKDGYYSDYNSPIATPCVQLVKDLDFLGLTELSKRAKEGEFDATKEESDEWYKREGRALALEVTNGNEEVADALFGKIEEEKEAKEGIKGWDY
jgi:hypothetical protein